MRVRASYASWLACALFLFAVPALAGPADAMSRVATPDDQARFLAGLPVAESSPLHALEATPAWREHAAELDARWAKLDEIRLSKMVPWAKAEIAPRIRTNLPVVYIFGGPDAISVDAVYPDAPVYVLCGLEPLGNVPRIETLPNSEIERGLANLRTSLRSTIDLSFFITSSMGKELLKTQIRGVLPIMYLFLARNGNHVLDTHTVYLDRSGKVNEVPPGNTPDDGVPGLRIRFRRGDDGAVKEMYYFRQDLTDDKLPKKPGLFPYLESLGPVNAFLKAASFILFDNRFSVTRNYLLGHSASVLQDDSGIPFHYFGHGRWDLVLFGEYTPTKHVFRNHFQPDMKKAWAEGTARELPFSTGYTHVGKSNLLLAIAKSDGTRS